MKFAAFILTFAFFVMPKCMAANGIAVTGNGTNSALNLTANFSGAVANVTETFDTSSKPTYIVSAFSANAGLKNGASVVPYTVSYACAAAVSTTVTISTMDQQIASRYNPPSASSCTGTISISFSGAAASQLYQGTYSDNITFSYRRNGSLVSTQALTL
ncbi:MAG: hypothetical protein H7333_06580, partial [Bdellovibrionales bacterium]|nr:hypothetical protein [Oligoflexia bacterium]